MLYELLAHLDCKFSQTFSLLISDAIASAENVRIAPSLRSQKGAIWTKTPTNFDWWEVDIVFRITGRGRIGADGLVSMNTCFGVVYSLHYSAYPHLWVLLDRLSGLLKVVDNMMVKYLEALTNGMALESFLIPLTMTINTTIPTLWLC